MSERKLVTLRQVSEVLPIDGADAIELALVDGWQCVVKKGEFKMDDLAVFFEVDSFVPASDSRFGFLSDKFTTLEGEKGARIKSMRLRGQLSQGLLLPLASFPEIIDQIDITPEGEEIKPLEEYDFTELVGVKKWDRPLSAAVLGTARGNFPTFIPKTNQERAQNIRNLFLDHGDEEFEITTKLNGSSMTIYHLTRGSRYFNPEIHKNDNTINTEVEDVGFSGVCSRNLDLEYSSSSSNMFWQYAAIRSSSISYLRHFCNSNNRSLAIQGELIAPSIQGNYELMTEPTFRVFDIYDIEAQRYLLPEERLNILDEIGQSNVQTHALNRKLYDWANNMERLLETAEGPGWQRNVEREGLVFKSMTRDFSFKVISNKYLLAEK